MTGSGLWLRAFVGLLLAMLPPIVLLVGASVLSETLLAQADPSLVALAVLAGAIIWAAGLAVVYARWIADDMRSFVALAERGESREDAASGTALRQVAAALDERDRQVSTMARESMAVPIDEEPQRVVRALIAAVRSVTRDSTWQGAVLASDDPELLPPQVVRPDADGGTDQPIADLERWASTSLADAPVARLEGPWGAFVAVDASVSDRLRVVLYAPWEGRAEPAPADIALLTLLGQHFGTALEHSLLYARVRRQADELDRLASVQADFLRGVTHDLQTPLTSIAALASELRADPRVGDAGRVDLETIALQAERLRRMVGQLLVASRLEAGAFTPHVDVVAVRPLVERTWAALRPGRPFEVVEEGEPHLAIADPDRLEQVLWALLDNAVKYSPDGSAISVTIRPDDGMLGVTVSDLGMGMDEDTQRRAFEQFYRSPNARSRAPDGSGVGLYAARGLIEAMGGRISVRSRLGAGTAITVTVPAEAVAE